MILCKSTCWDDAGLGFRRSCLPMTIDCVEPSDALPAKLRCSKPTSANVWYTFGFNLAGGLGFRVQGLGFKVQDSATLVSGLGFGV